MAEPTSSFPTMPHSSGLSVFTRNDRLIIKQKKENLEIFLGWESNNRFEITDEQGNVVLYAIEETDTCMRLCCSKNRAFTFNILDPASRDTIMQLKSDIYCCSQTVMIEAPPGNQVAQSYRPFAFCIPALRIQDASGTPMFRINAGCRACCGSCGDIEIPISDEHGEHVATVTKHYGGFFKELFTDADTFTLEYHARLDERMRATLFAEVFHIDMVFFERQNSSSG